MPKTVLAISQYLVDNRREKSLKCVSKINCLWDRAKDLYCFPQIFKQHKFRLIFDLTRNLPKNLLAFRCKKCNDPKVFVVFFVKLLN